MIKPVKIGLATGIVCGAFMILYGYAAMIFHGFLETGFSLIGAFYPLSNIGFLRPILAGVWGFIDCFVFFWLTFEIYNAFTTE